MEVEKSVDTLEEEYEKLLDKTGIESVDGYGLEGD